MFTGVTLMSPRRAALAARSIAVVLSLGGLLTGAQADVVKAEPQGFVLVIVAQIDAPPVRVYEAIVDEVDRWWHSAHTFSGDAANLSLDARAGGCFCEALASGGSVRHMEILFAAPGKQLRMQGGLGPLQGLAVAGSMTWQLREEAAGSRLELRYNVGGYLPDGLDAWAKPVDSVLTEQIQRLKQYLEAGSPEAGQDSEEKG